MERRNPYLVLGLPFGATRDEAVRAFARHTKFLRRQGPAVRDRHTDLTGALQELETAPPDAPARMSPYRIPADPSSVSSSGLFGAGVFAPAPSALAPSPDFGDLRRSAAFEYLRHVVRARGHRLGPPAP
jgi:hypothetical protein